MVLGGTVKREKQDNAMNLQNICVSCTKKMKILKNFLPVYIQIFKFALLKGALVFWWMSLVCCLPILHTSLN